MAVCQTDADVPLPPVNSPAVFWSITRTKEELSIVLPEKDIQKGWRVEAGWRILQVVGILDFNLIGVIASISVPLANAGISIYTLSTFNTDYILVKEKVLDRAVEVLENAGFQVLYSNP